VSQKICACQRSAPVKKVTCRTRAAKRFRCKRRRAPRQVAAVDLEQVREQAGAQTLIAWVVLAGLFVMFAATIAIVCSIPERNCLS
jgi:hypothetical protein